MYELRDEWPRETRAWSCWSTRTPRPRSAGINPFDHGPLHTDMWKTEGLKQALDKYGFDAAFGGARRDEEKSRAKERIFSFRSASHGWDPKNQRPELWKLYNAAQGQGREHPRLPDLATGPSSTSGNTSTWRTSRSCRSTSPRERPTVERDGLLLMVDDERLPLEPGEDAGDALDPLPHPGLLSADRRGRERGRDPARDHPGDAADHHLRAPGPRDRPGPGGAAMEKKKQEGYF